MPRQFIPSVEKGVRAQMERGVAAGYPVVDLRVTLVDGKAHCGRLLRHGLPDRRRAGAAGGGAAGARSHLLEPVDEVTVLVADEYVGAVMSDLSAGAAGSAGTEPVGAGRTLIRAEVPQIELTRYAVDLRSLSHGTATFTPDVPAARADAAAARPEGPGRAAPPPTPDATPLQRAEPGARLGGDPGVGEQLAGLAEQLGQHPGVRDDRHEVRVAAPARHDVLVQVRGDARHRRPGPGSARC